MKLTQSRLRQIIKEELVRTLRESAVSIDAEEIRRDDWQSVRTNYRDEEEMLPKIQKVVGSLEVSDPGMPNWDPSKDQVVFLGSAQDRSGQKVAYFKTSKSHHYYMLDIDAAKV